MSDHQVIIIGGGPAGMTTAIQLKRYGLDPVVFESRQLGGLLWNANLVENYPGFPGGISGTALVQRISRQFKDLGIALIEQHITQIDHDGTVFLVGSESGAFTSDVLVLATGTRANRVPPGLIPVNLADRVYYEVHDLANIHDGAIAIIGAGDAAFDYALNLASRGNKVIIFNRGGEIRALPLLVERVDEHFEIEYLDNTELSSVEEQDGKLLLGMVDGSGKTSYKVDALLGAIGRSPTGPEHTERFNSQMDLLQASGKLHIIGDLCNGIYRQTAIAVGDGLKAAMKIYQFLREEDKA